MITKELAKQLIEQAEYNCSGEKVEYNIDDILPLSEDGAYLVFASSESCKTSFVCYEDGTAYFLNRPSSLTDFQEFYLIYKLI